MKKICAILLSAVMLFMLSGPAAADVRRGDRGEGVAEIQTLLFQMGWLFEEPDGIFGPHTEEAVLNYQDYAGLKQDGVVDEATYDRMWEDWHYLFYDDGTPHNHGEDWDGDGIWEVEPDDESMAALHNFHQPDVNPPETESETQTASSGKQESLVQTQESETQAAASGEREGLVQTQESEMQTAVSGEREGLVQTQESETQAIVSEEREGLLQTQKAETAQGSETGAPETLPAEEMETETVTEAETEEAAETEIITEAETEETVETEIITEAATGEAAETEIITETETEETAETEIITEAETEETAETETEEITEAEETETEEAEETEPEKETETEQSEGWSLGKVIKVLGSVQEQLTDSVSTIKEQVGIGRR